MALAAIGWGMAPEALPVDGNEPVAEEEGAPYATAAQRLQEETARKLGTPVQLTVDLGQGVEMTFRLVPPGAIPRGRREVRITRPFYIGVHEVTQAQWHAVTGQNPSYFKDRDDSPDRPVERVSWNLVTDTFLPAIQDRAPAGMRFRLPTETEWEHACRAGTTTGWSFGNRITPELANIGDSGLRQTVPVGSYPPNAWGLYDMHGNVLEWCQDWFDRDSYTRAPVNDPVNLEEPTYGGQRVLRGGSWLHDAYNTRSVERFQHFPHYRNINAGVRLVLDFTTHARTK